MNTTSKSRERRNKQLKAAIAVVLALLLALAGTLAIYGGFKSSFGYGEPGYASTAVGARLHDDFIYKTDYTDPDGNTASSLTDRDIYVENYTDKTTNPNNKVYVRVKLREHYEYGADAGTGKTSGSYKRYGLDGAAVNVASSDDSYWVDYNPYDNTRGRGRFSGHA